MICSVLFKTFIMLGMKITKKNTKNRGKKIDLGAKQMSLYVQT